MRLTHGNGWIAAKRLLADSAALKIAESASKEKQRKMTGEQSSDKLSKLFRYIVCPTDEACIW
jgi:hypothetical protein